MIIYWDPLELSATEPMTIREYISSPYFRGVQRIKTFASYPTQKPYGALFHHSGYKSLFGNLEDFGWAAIPAGGAVSGTKILIDNDEVDSGETANTVDETTLKTISLPINTYTKILIEAVVRVRNETDADDRVDFTWRIKHNAVTKKTFTQRIIASKTVGVDSGDREVETISTIIAGGQEAAQDVTITGQMTVASADKGILCHSVRLWGII